MSHRQQYEPKQTTLPFAKEETKRKLCACGCGELATHGNKFIHGHYNKIWFPYEEAKERIQSLNLRSFREYCKLSKLGKLPERIPSAPHDVYDADISC